MTRGAEGGGLIGEKEEGLSRNMYKRPVDKVNREIEGGRWGGVEWRGVMGEEWGQL